MDFHKLIIPGSDFDPQLLDQACIFFLNSDPNDPAHEEVNQILIGFLNRPDNFNFCFIIINGDHHTYTKFLAYKILKKDIINNWNRYPDDEKENIRHIVLQSIVKMVQEGQKSFTISMADQSLIEILKYDWPQNWPLFIGELIETCKVEGIQFLKNGLDILKMLADDISPSKDLANGSDAQLILTKDRQRAMQSAFTIELGNIYSLLENAFSYSNASDQFSAADIDEINNKALNALISFIPVVGSERLLHTPLISGITPLLMNEKFTFHVFSIFGQFCEDISKTAIDDSIATSFQDSLLSIFRGSLEKIYSIIGEVINFNCVESEYLLMLVKSIHDFFKLFIPVMNMNQNEKEVNVAFNWIIQITNSGLFNNIDDLLFSELIRFWHFSSVSFYRLFTKENNALTNVFSSAISAVIPFLVKNVVSPYTFIEVSSDLNNRIQSSLSLNSYESSLYDTMKEILVVIYHLKKDELFSIITSLIACVQNNQFQAQTLNSISWSVGAICKAISAEENTTMMNSIVPIFISLINLENPSNSPSVEEIKFTASKALLFLCSQEARYFRSNPDFLNSLNQMILQFLTSGSSQLNIIAIHTFDLLSKSCKQTFITPIPPSNEMIISGILTALPTIINQMRIEHRSIFVSSIADIIHLYVSTFQGNQILDAFLNIISSIFTQSVTLIETTLSHFNNIPITISEALNHLNEYTTNLTINIYYQFPPLSLIDLDLLKNIINAISILNAIPLNLHYYFLPFFLSIADKLAQIYEMATCNSALINITDFSTESNPNIVNLANSSLDYYNELANLITDLFKNVLRITKPNNPEFGPILISSFFIGLNYRSLPPPSLPPNILTMYSSLFQFIYSLDIDVELTNNLMVKIFYEVFESIFLITANIIKDEYDTFYDLRIGMCELIKGIVRGRPSLLFILNEEHVDILVQMIIWLTKHPYEKISEKALEILFLLVHALKDPVKMPNTQAVDSFLGKYLLLFTSHIFTLLADPTYKFGFDSQTLILFKLFDFQIASQQINMIITQVNEIFNYDRSEQVIQQLFANKNVLTGFRLVMRDFLVEAKQYSVKDPELCAVEIFKKKRMETLENENIPGLKEEEQIRPENIEEEVSFLSSVFSGMSF